MTRAARGGVSMAVPIARRTHVNISRMAICNHAGGKDAELVDYEDYH